MFPQTTNLILYSLTIPPSIAQLYISIYVLRLMILRRQIFREHRLDYLLFANTYIAALFLAGFFLDLSIYSIYGLKHPQISFDGWWCKIKGYICYTSGYVFFYSFALQAIYRLCRILYRTKLSLQSFRLYAILFVGLWFFTSLELLPSLLVGDIEYIVHDYHCQFAPTSVRASLTLYSIGFALPFSITIFCYIWTLHNIRRQTAALATIAQQASLHRDMIILKRLMIFLSIVTIVSIPHLILPLMYVTNGSLPEWISFIRMVHYYVSSFCGIDYFSFYLSAIEEIVDSTTDCSSRGNNNDQCWSMMIEGGCQADDSTHFLTCFRSNFYITTYLLYRSFRP